MYCNKKLMKNGMYSIFYVTCCVTQIIFINGAYSGKAFLNLFLKQHWPGIDFHAGGSGALAWP
jgi:hypothetical protein